MKKVKTRFAKHKRNAFVIGFCALWFGFYILFIAACGVGENMAGMRPEKLSQGFYLLAWCITAALVFFLFWLALEIEKFQQVLNKLEQTHIDLVKMQQAYTRSAEVSESRDRINGTYHDKVYRSAVADIEQIINK